jgi:hypothetical protein
MHTRNEVGELRDINRYVTLRAGRVDKSTTEHGLPSTSPEPSKS